MLSSPLFSQVNGFENQDTNIQINIDEATKKLEEAGWKMDGSFRKKGETALEFELVTTDWPELNQTANLLAEQWKKVGAKVDVKVLTISDLQQNYIRTREYDSILFGQAITFSPDFHPYWHSSNKRDPGLNLALFDNKDADGLLEGIRQEANQEKRTEQYKQFQEILNKEIPAVFLYSPYYLYPVNTGVQGMDVKNINAPQHRFVDVNKWYIKTSRVLK